MANPFGSFLSAIGLGEAPEQAPILSTQDLLNQTYGAMAQSAPGLIAYNQAIAPGLTDVQLGVTNQLDPSILANYRGANKSILDTLNMGGNFSPEINAQITGDLLSTGAASGFGSSAGGIGGVLYQRAVEQENRKRQNVQDALNAGRTGLSAGESLFSPQGLLNPMAVASDIRGVNAATQNATNAAENYKRNAFSNLIKTGLTIAGAVGGGLASGGALTGMGASIGSNIGGAFMSGPQQTYAPSAFSFLNGLGGSNYGGTPGQIYADASGNAQTSILPQAVNFAG